MSRIDCQVNFGLEQPPSPPAIPFGSVGAGLDLPALSHTQDGEEVCEVCCACILPHKQP